MHKPTGIFIATLIMFATGTSAIGYSLAQDSFNAAQPIRAAFTLVPVNTAPWYCVSAKAVVKASGVDGAAGYNNGVPPSNAGYQQPTRSGYQPANSVGSIDRFPQPNLQSTAFNPDWQKLLPPCPTGYNFNEALVVKKCSAALQKKLDGNPLPAESKEQYVTCVKILKSAVWNAKISQTVCSAFYLYENDCAAAQKAKKACQPLSKYLTTAGVSKADIPKTQSDAIYLCKDVYPKP